MPLLRSPLQPFAAGDIVFRSHFPISHTKPSRILPYFLPVSNRLLDSNGAVEGGGDAVRERSADVATLGNLCVDVVLGVSSLPPANPKERKDYMENLAASPPDKKYWEAGGNCNLAIAAARIGLHCVSLGHVGNDIYGHFLQDVLYEEGISMVAMNEHSEDAQLYSASYQTLLCWVLVDPFQRHGFCSVADFCKEPAFSWMTKLSRPAKTAITRSRILFCNGYVFDELFPKLITSALDCAIEAGTAVFFDPGPRGRTLSKGNPDERYAIEQFLKLSDVLLFTSEEAEAVTGIHNPVKAGKDLLTRGIRVKWVIVKMGSRGSILIAKSSISGAPGFKVRVVDTVGCGDSFTAAVAFGFLCKMPTVSTLTLANAVGAATASGCGAGRNVATLEKVLQLLRAPDLNEGEPLISVTETETEAIVLLSQHVVNGRSAGRITLVSIDKVVSEVLPKLEALSEPRICHLERWQFK